MPLNQPEIQEVEQAIIDLLREQEVGALAVAFPDGTPSASLMHFASDRLSVYCHTYTYTRKYAALRHDPRAGYTLAHLPPDGFSGRTELRAIQVTGRATFLTDQREIERAIEVSREQFAWLNDSNIYNSFKREGVEQRQAFFRIDPVEALWNDNRVHMLYRTIVTFSPDGKHVAALAPYETKVPQS